jgi:hypothetical protein
MRDALVNWQVWWTDFWFAHPIVFCVAMVAGLTLVIVDLKRRR